jgi:hypothetical protein
MPTEEKKYFWNTHSNAGRKPIFSSPEHLEKSCIEYFTWNEENPLYESKLVSFQGSSTIEKLPKMRAMTITGLCIFLDIDQTTWRSYGRAPEFSWIVNKIDEIIRTQKFTGAAADMLNPNIIARDLGLANREELTGANGGPIEIMSSAADEAKRKLLALVTESES